MLTFNIINRLSQRYALCTILILSMSVSVPWTFGQDQAGSVKQEDLAKTAAIKTTAEASTGKTTESTASQNNPPQPTEPMRGATPSPTFASPAGTPSASADLGAKTAEQGAEMNRKPKTNAMGGPFSNEMGPIEIFDKEKEEKATPIQRAINLLAERKTKQLRSSLDSMRNLITYEYEVKGGKEKKLLEQATLQALEAAAGRLYFANYYLLGRDLLEPYLKNSGKQFIARTSVVEEHNLDRNQMEMKVRLSVNLDTFYKDLEDKKFIAEPNPRPIIAIFLREVVEEQPDTSAQGRIRIEQTMEQNMFLARSTHMKDPPLNQDLTSAPNLLKRARMEAQRNNVDVLITGSLAVHSLRQDQIYYDHFDFEEAELSLSMYRVDTGELIAQTKDRYSASAPTTPEAIKSVLDVMVKRSAQKLAQALTGMWSNTMLEGQGNIRIIVNRANPNEVTSIYNLLRTLSPKLKIYEKSYFGDVLVFNVALADTSASQLEDFLRDAKEPQFLVRRVDKRDFVLDLI